jgi:hypothetical protein
MDHKDQRVGEPAMYISPVGCGTPPFGSRVMANADISRGLVNARFSILKKFGSLFETAKTPALMGSFPLRTQS